MAMSNPPLIFFILLLFLTLAIAEGNPDEVRADHDAQNDRLLTTLFFCS